MTRTYLSVGLSWLLLTATPLACWLPGCNRAPPGPKVPEVIPFRADGWNEIGGLLLRYESDERNRLLIRQLDGTERIYYDREDDKGDLTGLKTKNIYRYDANRRVLERVPAAVWTAATGAVIDSMHVQNVDSLDPGPFGRDPQGWTLTFRGKPVQTVAPTLLTVFRSPDRSAAGVASAEGRPRKTGMWPLGGTEIKGRRYFELFSATDGSRIWGPLEFGLERDSQPSLGCWTEDGRFLIYYHVDKLWIVEVPGYLREQKP